MKILSTLALCTLLVGCSSLHHAQVATEIHQDSTHHGQIRYDSIYIYHSHEKDYRRASHPELVSESVAPDTIYLRETEIEYRYKLLRDTVRIVQRDSIPYEVLVTEIKEVRHIPWWSKALSCIGALCIAFLVIKLMLKR